MSSHLSSPVGSPRRTSLGTSSSHHGRPSSAQSRGKGSVRMAGGLPPPPPMMTASSSTVSGAGSGGANKSYAQSISQSMTIEEMRDLHQRALQDAEAKRTELRLVLASRYRELVGSSDEVLKMRERSQELHELVHALPGLLTTLMKESEKMTAQVQKAAAAVSATAQEESKEAPVPLSEHDALLQLRRDISTLPRVVHRSLDQRNVHGAALNLIELFTLLAHQTDSYSLATALAKSSSAMTLRSTPKFKDPALNAQMKMTFLHIQTLPDKTTRLSKRILEGAASYGPLLTVSSSKASTLTEQQTPVFGAQWSAAALSALDMLETTSSTPANRAARLLDLYYDSKAKLLQSLLAQLHTSSTDTVAATTTTTTTTNAADGTMAGSSGSKTKLASPANAEEILSKILLILQYDIILHPYQLFVLRNFPVTAPSKKSSAVKAAPASAIVASLPSFDESLVRAKCSHFLAAHLPLLRTKVKSILVSIAGTTASALGQMRQSLYDKTDGADCMALLKDETTNLCTWDDAITSLVDIPTVAAGGGMPILHAAPDGGGPRFSLWSALFSNTFSSLVHNILTTSFHSVHTKVVSTLRTSLASAPPLEAMRPHEAYRNALKIATDLDQALWNVRKDAHELLVHAEEREESERRLRLSLYVQTCEIMGRLVCELRRMILLTSKNASGNTKSTADAVQELIVGRLCYLLKFRLTSLPTLLDPQSAPSSAGVATSAAAPAAGGSNGMITLVELQSAFELADDNDDGLITFEEAMEAVDSAFSGTPFRGAEMVRETLLLSISGAEQVPVSSSDLMLPSPKSMESIDLDVGAAITKSSVAPVNVTLSELALLTARGLRHEITGANSALGTVQQALDNIVENCFQEWAKASLRPSLESLSSRVEDFYRVGSTTKEEEWNRLYHTGASPGSGGAVEKVSPIVVGYLLDVCSVLNRTIFPSDSLLPVPSIEYASSLGIVAATSDPEGGTIPTMKDTIRWSLVRQSLALITNTYQDAQVDYERLLTQIDEDGKKQQNELPFSALLQLKTDLSFVQTCFFERLQRGLATKFEQQKARDNIFGLSKSTLERLVDKTDTKLRRSPNATAVARTIPEKHQQVLEATDLFISSLLGGSDDATEAATGAVTVPPVDLGTSSTNQTPWIHNPLQSSRRFALLPIQSDRGLTEMQLRKYGKKSVQDSESNQQDSSAGLMGQNIQKGLGFFSNILRT